MILVDSNVLIDVIFEQKPWYSWSRTALEVAGEIDDLAINGVIVAEVAHNFTTPDDLMATLDALRVERFSLTKVALFAASRAFLAYRRRGGTRTGVLLDFFIGAQALTEDWTLLTRDAGRYRTYFPHVRLIAPDAA